MIIGPMVLPSIDIIAAAYKRRVHIHCCTRVVHGGCVHGLVRKWVGGWIPWAVTYVRECFCACGWWALFLGYLSRLLYLPVGDGSRICLGSFVLSRIAALPVQSIVYHECTSSCSHSSVVGVVINSFDHVFVASYPSGARAPSSATVPLAASG